MQIVRDQDSLIYCDNANAGSVKVFFLEESFRYMTVQTWSGASGARTPTATSTVAAAATRLTSSPCRDRL